MELAFKKNSVFHKVNIIRYKRSMRNIMVYSREDKLLLQLLNSAFYF